MHMHRACAHCGGSFRCDGTGCAERFAFPEPHCRGCLRVLQQAFYRSILDMGGTATEAEEGLRFNFGSSYVEVR